ncbi:hypothetical protein [Caldicellulosiruptor morganii]|uniref:PIN domain-containing protein n=1 Tax=Caldicellulosiruptor morganii TaxID=1387555 RepID=A0ABY7BQM1_9FIRM|nr:hypothetical protein [Caldicellulosiruptor morganii]WAM34095.1 hypothetical protein OTK00_000253 [Caldicellulosiruptor morganii]
MNAVIDTSTFINIKNASCECILDYLNYNLLATIYVLQEIDKAHEDTKKFYETLKRKNKIHHVKLTINDLLEMAKVPPHKKKISDAELSCFVKAKNLGTRALCDDKKAFKYVRKYIQLNDVFGIIDLIKDAYLKNYICDEDVREFQKRLNNTKCRVPDNLLEQFAAEKLKCQMENS